MLSKKMLVADLFTFYGELLTDKQRDVLSLYCFDDLSLGEIAEDLKISRQGVHDTVKRSSKTLESYENKLGLMEKFNNNTVLLSDINTKMVDLSRALEDKSIDNELLKEKVKEVVTVVIRDIDDMIE